MPRTCCVRWTSRRCALSRYREIRGYGTGHPLLNLGRIYLRLGRVDDAVTNLTEAVREHRATGELFPEAMAHKYLGQAHEDTGNVAEAQKSLTTALAIFEQIGERAEAAEVASALASLPTQ
jgi:tetratricopeptide (TPR) repeat protein